MNKDMLELLPKPKKVSFARGAFDLGGGALACRVPEGADLDAFFKENGGRFRQASGAEPAAVMACIDRRVLEGRAHDPALLDEGYALDVSARGIRLTARTDRGLYYGLQSLRQLAQGSRRLPALRLEDWPDMRFRGLHLMLGALMPTFARMKRIVEILARHKMNAFVVEYDHCFKWEKYPFIAHPDALTKDQARELESFAADRFVEIIPCLDSLGHQQPYLGHKELAHLREKPNSSNALCPSNPKSMAFMQDLWREILDAHPRARRAHITGDEVFYRIDSSTFCPACRAKARKQGTGSLIVDYYTELSRWIRRQGREPMMWDDMLAKHADVTTRIPNDIVLCDWNYDGYTADAWSPEDLYWNQMTGADEKAWDANFRAYWKPDRHGSIRPFPYLRYFLDKGHPVIGCTAASGGCALPYVSNAHKQANIMRFADTVRQTGALGLMNTYWPSAGPLESAWNAVLMAADYGWHSRIETPAAYGKRFTRAFLGAAPAARNLFPGLEEGLFRAAPGKTACYAKVWPEKSLQSLVHLCRALPPADRDRDRGLFTRSLDWCVRFSDATARLGAMFNRLDAARLGRGIDRPVDIRRHATHGFLNATRPGASAVPFQPGLCRPSGVPFTVIDPARNGGKAVIALQGENMRQARRKVTGIDVNRKADRVFFLCSGYDAYEGTAIAEVVFRMEDGGEHRFPVVGGENILDWSSRGNRVMPKGVFATERRDHKGCVCWWDNPEPGKRIASMDFSSKGDKGSLTIAGVTTRVFSGKQPSVDQAVALKALADGDKEIGKLIAELTGRIYPAMMAKPDIANSTRHLVDFWRNWLAIYRRILRETMG